MKRLDIFIRDQAIGESRAKNLDIFIQDRSLEVYLRDRLMACDVVAYNLTYQDRIAASNSLIISSDLSKATLLKAVGGLSAAEISTRVESVAEVVSLKDFLTAIITNTDIGVSAEKLFSTESVVDIAAEMGIAEVVQISDAPCASGLVIDSSVSGTSLQSAVQASTEAELAIHIGPISAEKAISDLLARVLVDAVVGTGVEKCFVMNPGTTIATEAELTEAVLLEGSLENIAVIDVDVSSILVRLSKLADYDGLSLSEMDTVSLEELDYVEIAT